MILKLQLEEDCNICSLQSVVSWDDTSQLNDSQVKAVLSCLQKICCEHKSFLDLIWGPPGTGKTKTVSMMLYVLRSMGKRVLTCAPTNAAIKEVSSRLVKLLNDSPHKYSGRDDLFCSLGDVVLFGSKERLGVDCLTEEIYLEYRVQRLAECFAPLTGWRHCFSSMIDLIQNCSVQYHIFLENKLMMEKGNDHGTGKDIKTEDINSFLDFIRKRFSSSASDIRRCVSIMCSHISKSYLLEHNFKNLVALMHLVDSLENLLSQDDILLQEIEEVFTMSDTAEECKHSLSVIAETLLTQRNELLSLLKVIRDSLYKLNLPDVRSMEYLKELKEFCLQTASLIFCTASTSYKLHSVEMPPLDVVVIDEAAQLKECETAIPLQLQGIRHAILIGDEFQLPAMVRSKVCLFCLTFLHIRHVKSLEISSSF